MTVTIHCPCCHHPARIPANALGRRVRCPRCQHTLVVSVLPKARTRS